MFCVLSKDGRAARDELMRLLYGTIHPTYSQLKRDTGLDGKSTIPRIQNMNGSRNDPGVQPSRLGIFFSALLNCLCRKADVDGEDVIKFLEDFEITSYFVYSVGNQKLSDQWVENLDYLYAFAQIQDDTKSIKSSRSFSSSVPHSFDSNFPVNMFDELGYKIQEDHFKEILAIGAYCSAFSISAPCDTTQRWLLNRLIRRIDNYENAERLAVNLRRSDMRHDLNSFRKEKFWEALSNGGAISYQEKGLAFALHSFQSDKPVIFTIYNFDGCDVMQNDAVREFLAELARIEGESQRRSIRSRIVIFLVDKFPAFQRSVEVVKLQDLNRVPLRSQSELGNVKDWLGKKVVSQWWTKKYGTGFDERLLNKGVDEMWNEDDPWGMLDKICFNFGLEGFDRVAESWRWSS